MTTGITNIGNLQPELPLQWSEKLLSTPQFNLIHSIGVDLHSAKENMGKTTRMSRYERLSTDGGLLDGSGIDPAPEVVVRSDIDAEMEVFAKSIVVNEQVTLYENDQVLTRFTMLLGQWLREKEDLLMRDLWASAPTSVKATGGVNGDDPCEITRPNVNNIERLLLNNDAHTMLQGMPNGDQFGHGPVRDAFIALCSTEIVSDLQNVSGVVLKASYPGRPEDYKPEEYCAIGRFRFFVSSRGAKTPNASLRGATVFDIPMYGVEAASKIEQNGYSAVMGYRPPAVVSRVAQNAELYAKFAIARAITNQAWVARLQVTQRL